MERITKRFFLALFCAVCLASLQITALGQENGKPSIKFAETTFDFGTIKEDGGPVTHEFVFENTGDGNLVIHSARAECGCTKPKYPEEPIAPGKSAVIKVTYNPAGRPGGFTKVVTVRCNGNPSKVNLKIRGTVTPSAKTLSMRYPVGKGNLRFETDKIVIGNLTLGQRRQSFVGLYNNGNQNLVPVFSSDSKALEVSVSPDTIAPGQTGLLSLYFNSKLLGKIGNHNLTVSGKWGDKDSDSQSLSFQAIILPRNS